MEYFEKYTSNTYAGSGNQLYFGTNGKVKVGRVFYKISVGGSFNYSLLFSNIIDSTYADGKVSHKNLICDEWTIHGMKLGRCKELFVPGDITKMVTEDVDYDFKEVSFKGEKTKKVMPGEFFTTDPLMMTFDKGDYLCLEVTFSGEMIPYHEESLLPVLVKEGDKFRYSKFMPFASMIGCDRDVKSRISYLGDSITQGIGAKPNSYLHWNAILSDKLGDNYSYWNLGIGFGRANDAASDGAWLYKAKQSDIVFVCYGVNDILRGLSEEQIKADLTCITETLKACGKKVILQTIPPFDYTGDYIGKWNRLNSYILDELKNKVDFVFDNRGILGNKDNPEKAIYGGHPNEEGGDIWARALFNELEENNIL